MNVNTPTNNTNQKNSISTSLMQLFDDNGVQFRMSGLDNGISFAFWLPLVDPMTGRRTYPKEQRFQCVVSSDRVKSLDKMVQDLLLPAAEQGNNKSIAVFTNKQRSNIFEVRFENGDYYVRLYQNVDAMSLKPNNVYEFKFRKTQVGTDYNPATGEINMVLDEGEFYIFLAVIHNYVELAASKMPGHAERLANEYTTGSIFNHLKAIATKLGVTVSNQYQYAPSYTAENNAYQVGSTTNVSSEVPLTEINETDLKSLLD